MSSSTTTTTTTQPETEEQRIIMRCLLRGATEGRLRVSGRVHTGGTRPSFAGAAHMWPEPTIRVSSGTSFLARITGLTSDKIVVKLGPALSPIACSVQYNTFGEDGVWMRLDAEDQEELHWFYLELYAPCSPPAAPALRETHAMVRRSSAAARRN